jgi:hypothetical protein
MCVSAGRFVTDRPVPAGARLDGAGVAAAAVMEMTVILAQTGLSTAGVYTLAMEAAATAVGAVGAGATTGAQLTMMPSSRPSFTSCGCGRSSVQPAYCAACTSYCLPTQWHM